MDDFFPIFSNLDLREEFEATLYGRVDVGPGQGRPVVLRRLTDDPCVCFDHKSGSGRQDCPYCFGEGWSFFETREILYIARGVAPVYKPGFLATGQYPQAPYGYTDPNRATAFCSYTVFPEYTKYIDGTKKNFDKMYELKVGPDGGIFYPETRATKWKLMTLTPLHGDRGRIEFIELALEVEDFQ